MVKILLVMKIIVLLLTTAILQVSASSYGQNVTLKQSNARLSTVLDEIRKQTGYDFFYSQGMMENAKLVNVTLSKVTIEEALEICFKNQPLSYTIENKIVTVKEKEPTFLDRIVSAFSAVDIRGKIVGEDGVPIAGANVSVKGTNKSAITDQNGAFYIAGVDERSTLVISYVGYVTREVAAAATTMGDIKLILSEGKLEEVMINAGYYSVKDSERTGNIARITSKDIETQPVTNVLATMQGRMPGVEIIQDGGTAGGGFQIRVRGLNSLRENGNELLYIVDGVPYSSELIGYYNTATSTATPTSPLNSINASDIESIEVLKDADATAIYGSRGANGVVLITTKKGKAGKTQLSIISSAALGKVTKMAKLMNTQQYLEMRRQGFANDGLTSYPATAYDINGTWNQTRYTDWQDVLMGGTAKINNIQGSISGGSEQTQYLFSGMYRTEGTVVPGDFKYGKGAVHLNINHNSPDKKFKFVFSGGYTVQDNRQPETDVTRSARNLAPNAPALFKDDGSLNFEKSTFQNPLATLRAVTTAKINDLVANAVLSYQIIPGLELKTNLGYTNLNNTEQRLFPSTTIDPARNRGSDRSSMFLNLTSRGSWIVEPQVSWAHDFKFAKFETLIGTTFQQQQSSYLYEFGMGFASNSLITNIASATYKETFGSTNTAYKYQAVFARFNFKLDEDKYIINLTARRDGSSRFGPGKQFGFFGAVGAAWLFSREDFLKGSDVLSFGKLRVSYGSSGNDQIGDYQFLDTYTSSGLNYQGLIGLDPTRLYNPDFGWESNRKLEAALEAGFLKDRIFLTAAWYQNRSSNQLVGIPLPGTTGFRSINANLDATVQNSGIELSLRTINVATGAFNWTSSFNVSKAKNKLISFPGLAGSTYSNRYVIGESINIAKVYRFMGLNSQTGLYEVDDANKDGAIRYSDDRKTIVDFNPEFFGGLQNEFSYKKWRLDFLFQFVKQRVYDYNPNVQGGAAFNQRAELANAWVKPGDATGFQKNSSGLNGDAIDAFYNFIDSDAAIVDGSYVRLKNISLSYELSKPILKVAHCKLSLQGQNILTFTSYKGGDPEFKYTAYLPPLRIYNASIQLTF
jgi:TonB-linked SusC/RagA family outer membrane protein